jgi:hypothetical protein
VPAAEWQKAFGTAVAFDTFRNAGQSGSDACAARAARRAEFPAKSASLTLL